MKSFGGVRAEKLSSRRHIKEEIANEYRGPVWMSFIFDVPHSSALDHHFSSSRFVFCSRVQFHSSNRSDRSERLPAEPQSCDRAQVLRPADLRRGVTFKRKQSVVSDHSVTIISHFKQPPATAFDFDRDAACTGVDRILDQLFCHRGRPLDYFTGGDLIGDVIRENANLGHN